MTQKIIIAFDIHGVLFTNDYWQMVKTFVRSPLKYRCMWYGLNPLVWFSYFRFARAGFIVEHRITLLLERYTGLRPCLPLIMAVANAQKPQPDVVELVKELRDAGYELHILSNIGPIFGADLQRQHPSIFAYFTAFYTPSAAHAYKSKKHPAVFRAYAQEYHARADCVVVIDDSRANIAMARFCALRGTFYSNPVQLRRELADFGVLLPCRED